MTESLAGQVILVTGASRGIGAATARRLAALGATVVRVSRSEAPALERAVDFRADLADPGSRSDVLRSIHEAVGVPQVIVNNAGAFLLAPLEGTSDELLRGPDAATLDAYVAAQK